MALLKQMETSDPSLASPHLYLSQLYLSELDGPDYLIEARVTARLRNGADDLAMQQAAEKGYAAGGAAGMLGNMLEVQKELYNQQRLEAYTLAQTEALLGEREAALRYLSTAVSRKESLLSIMRIDPALSTLHSSPSSTSCWPRQACLRCGKGNLSVPVMKSPGCLGRSFTKEQAIASGRRPSSLTPKGVEAFSAG